MVSNILETAGQFYLDPIEAFTEEHMRQSIRLRREGKPTTPDPLFNGQLGDGHFSRWVVRSGAHAVEHRLVLLIEEQIDAKMISF